MLLSDFIVKVSVFLNLVHFMSGSSGWNTCFRILTSGTWWNTLHSIWNT